MKFALSSDIHYGFSGKMESKLRRELRKLRKNIKEQDIKALILAGDIASSRQRQFKRCLELIREYIDIDIVLVRGNHDFWDGEDPKSKEDFRSLEKLMEWHKLVFKYNNIHHLEDNPLVIDDVLICGFDGWYASTNPNTNDINYIPKIVEGVPMAMPWLSRKAWRDFDKCLALDTKKYRKSIIVTHHNLTPFGHWSGQDDMGGNFKFLDEIKEKFDVLCYGHTHVFNDTIEDGTRILNSGSDYGSPKFLIFEV